MTETYISLRRLENEALKVVLGDQIILDMGDVIRVSIGQFYGIEINDFAVTVAKTALWIAESQMMKETESIVHKSLNFLPLKSYANIIEANALRIDWETVVPKEKLNYIMGNPPYVGHSNRSKEQAEDVKRIFTNNPKAGKLDYVACWYKLASKMIENTSTKVGFVSTNSISQGEQVAILWKDLFANHKIQIVFAYRSFVWETESINGATVHCVIIGFSTIDTGKKYLFEGDRRRSVSRINGYLVESPDLFIQARGKPLYEGMPKMTQGSKPVDGGNLIFSVDEYNKFVSKYPDKKHLLKQYVGADDYINNKVRFCLWLLNVSPIEYRKIPEIVERISNVATKRASSPTPGFRAAAETPSLFAEIRQPTTMYLAIPEVSSERRRYVPIGYMSPDIILANTVYSIQNASLYTFGVMISNVHMAWMRTVCGRLEMRYRYTPAVYNNYPWPEATEQQKAEIEKTAQAILDARELYPDCSLADLYDELTMPPELRKAHQANDKAVMKAYGFKKDLSESAIVAELMKMYQELVSK